MKEGLGGRHCIWDTTSTGHIFSNQSMRAGGDLRTQLAESAGGAIAPSDTQARLILKLKCMFRRARNNICCGCTYCGLCLALRVH